MAAGAQPVAAGDTFLAMIYLEGPSGLARDRFTVTSQWQALQAGGTPQDLATQLANGMTIWLNTAHDGHVTVYKSDFAPPGTIHPPLASVRIGTAGNFIALNGPGEIALCLSYYCSFNTKRYRGRNYIPFAWIYNHQGVSAAPPASRPVAAQQQAALDFFNLVYKPVKTSSNWQWVLKSPTDKAFKIITNCWVDDEWDTLRSRGLRGTSRLSAIV
jgi:hypothetical protein